MVRALLAGMKTQTRRLVEPQPPHDPQHDHTDAVGSLHRWWAGRLTLGKQHEARCRYGQPGDRLWVRESGWERPALSARDLREGADTWPPYEYDVEPVCCWEEGELKRLGWKRRPSIHMPRRASRILLEITGVRVERLQDISEADATAEGAPPSHPSIDRISREFGYADFSRSWFAQLWESINGPESWAANPWVWVIEFQRVEAS